MLSDHLWRLDDDIVPVHTHDDRSFLIDRRPSGGADAVLSGPAEGTRRTVDRLSEVVGAPLPRRTLLAGLAACAALTVVDARPRYAFAAPTAASATKDTLVVIFLRGGADALNILVPDGDPDYLRARPRIGLKTEDLWRLDGTFGFHPKMAALKPAWEAGQLAAVAAVGNPDATRSHFDAELAMERAAPAQLRSGWLGRYLAASSGDTSLVRAVTLGDRAVAATTTDFPTAAIGGRLKDFDVSAWDGFKPQVKDALRVLGTSGGGAVAEATGKTFDAIGALAAARTAPQTPANGASYPATDFGRAMAEIARIIRSGAPVEAACVDRGNWDMHANEGGPFEEWGWLARNLTDLAGSLAAFRTDLGDSWSRTTVVAMTEFGRRVAENTTNGADHGSGALMLVAGGGVNGGKVYGRWPTLAGSALKDGDLAITTDYRSVIAEVLGKRLPGAAASTVFPGFTPTPLGLAKPRA